MDIKKFDYIARIISFILYAIATCLIVSNYGWTLYIIFVLFFTAYGIEQEIKNRK